ncbi:hypothetical protein HMPREF1548_01101 [Clostridium sp. KLE 1755]|nr:hypothetical protein HMPREF1548_01101 [Clostridium sp. KLE 1755]
MVNLFFIYLPPFFAAFCALCTPAVSDVPIISSFLHSVHIIHLNNVSLS